MAKRFTDTELWDKAWFMELKAKHKLLIKYLFDKCDVAGIWQPNWVLASTYIGEQITPDDLAPISSLFISLPNGKIFIKDFIKFQYGKLSKDCKPHIPIYRILANNGIDIDTIEMSDAIGKTHNVTPLQKALVLKQDNYTCCYCGKEKEERNLIVDHVIPRTKGGSDELKNLVASCVPCNAKKSWFSIEEFCLRHDLDFETISQRVSERLSKRLSNNLKEKEKDMDKERVKDKVKDKEKEKEEAPKKIENPFSANFLKQWQHWKDYKQQQQGFTYKSVISEQAAINDLVKLSKGDEITAGKIIMQSMAHGWKGLFELKTDKNGNEISEDKLKEKLAEHIRGWG
jgi:hypothetical protein